MTEESRLVFRGSKCAGIILSMCELFGISLKKATDIYYKSETASLIEDGVADLQCRSDKYLATLVWEEYMEKHPPVS
jgi:hypothetical protein